MRWVAASEFYHEPPDEHVIRSLDTAEFLWWTAGQGIRRAWPEALHRHLKLSDESQHVIGTAYKNIKLTFYSVWWTVTDRYICKYTGNSIIRTSRENENWLEKNRFAVWETAGKITVFDWRRETVLVRVIGRFEKSRVRQIVFHCLKIWF